MEKIGGGRGVCGFYTLPEKVKEQQTMENAEISLYVAHQTGKEIERESRLEARKPLGSVVPHGVLKGPSLPAVLRRVLRSALCLLVAAPLLTGCLWWGDDKPATSQAPPPKPVELIDLDKVLTALSQTLEEMDLAAIGRASGKELSEMAAVPTNQAKETMVASKKLDQKSRDQFFVKFSEKLDKVQPLKRSFGVFIDPEGAIKGFDDRNRNKTKDAQEQELFKIFIDQRNKRLIASDFEAKEPHHRDYSYADFIPGSFTHTLLGSMLNDQMEKQVDTSRFAEIKISPKDYHKQASQPPAGAPPAGK
jgi:hypothetical protein